MDCWQSIETELGVNTQTVLEYGMGNGFHGIAYHGRAGGGTFAFDGMAGETHLNT